jgi:hypothetical protein
MLFGTSVNTDPLMVPFPGKILLENVNDPLCVWMTFGGEAASYPNQSSEHG